MMDFVARAIFPFTLVTALALLLRAYADIGDGFSAGAVAGLGAVLQYVALGREAPRRAVGARFTRYFMVGGLMLTLCVVFVPLTMGLPPVTHFPRAGSPGIAFGVLELHTAGLFDLGVALAVYGAVVGTFDRLFPPAQKRNRP